MVCAQPQYEVQVQLPVEFQHRVNQTNRLADGTCCESSETASNCVTGCSNIRVVLCVREEQHDRTDMDSSNCPLGLITAPLTRDHLFTFTARPGATNTTTYPVSVLYLFTIHVIPYTSAKVSRCIGQKYHCSDRQQIVFVV